MLWTFSYVILLSTSETLDKSSKKIWTLLWTVTIPLVTERKLSLDKTLRGRSLLDVFCITYVLSIFFLYPGRCSIFRQYLVRYSKKRYLNKCRCFHLIETRNLPQASYSAMLTLWLSLSKKIGTNIARKRSRIKIQRLLESRGWGGFHLLFTFICMCLFVVIYCYVCIHICMALQGSKQAPLACTGQLFLIVTRLANHAVVLFARPTSFSKK